MIVGAGFAGLSAAERLVSMGVSVLVVEGRDRVGGRSLSGEVAGVKVDLGATWVARRHTAIRSLASRVGCGTTSQFNRGHNVLWMAGRRHTYTGTLPMVSPAAMVDMARIQTALNKLVSTINVDAAWESPHASRLDDISFGEWLDQKHALGSTRALMTIVSKVQWGCSPGDVSLLHALRYIRAAGGIDHMLDVEGGQQQDRITETTQEIARRLAERLGDSVVVGSPVRRITQDDNGVTVRTDSDAIKAKYVIVTAAPAHRADIEFQPALPEKSEGLTKTWRMGALSKAFVAYHEPFWRADGLSGEALTDTGTVFITFDVSPNDTGPGVLMAFCDPRVFDGFSPENRRSRVIRQLVDLYGPRANSPIDYVDHCWGTEPFAPGGPNPAVPPYASVSHASALTEPHGRVHWAGTETAGEWAGTMNGAVLTGQRAAERVAALLSHDAREEPTR
ncbi:flavin monoamine oxidase family protein [Streptoalloteichus tenebrarius]|uniref:flavin monoamine oxidase family protein n=1 Tax=Streptoalloteichus tenebrarius (strain ATCC 17920 / DSM 40477 / JCM 4838 / CBS 697.72 / NBRC 16177 / NCIMB 11028 / NRRL B-12390 / A12253. 1 / ISP 5477) TaxID=1933 RepID=UPI0020A23DA5|nr:flavin monoamine oxidase family protein [Streptoalloteichus tenebrarius]